MKPGRIVIFLLSLISIVGFVIFLFPFNEIYITDNFSIKVPQYQDYLNNSESEFKALDIFLDSSDNLTLLDTFHLISIDTNFIKEDTVLLAETVKDSIVDTPIQTKIVYKEFKYRLTPLEYPDNNVSLLNHFFEEIQHCYSKEELIRILHYGDSQIEGDRITTYIRYHLQKQFGGMGTGLFPVKLINKNYISLHLEVSNNWERYTYYSYKNGNFPNNKIGAMLTVSRFTPPIKIISPNMPSSEGNLFIDKSQLTYNLNRDFKQCRIFYGYNKTPLISEVRNNEKAIDAELIAPSSSVQVLTYDLEQFPEGLRINFKGQDSPDIYGIALDGYAGVAMDNISLRGSKGLEFTKVNQANLQQMYDLLNVKLIVLQFGVNLVPTLKKTYDDYEKAFYKQLVLLKSLLPEIQIIVMGVSDMSRKENGQMVTYPNIEAIRLAQKNACFQANCIFWDTYEAMGGENSMPSWVNNDPPLGQKDYTHFSFAGAKVIARMFYEAIMNDYNKFLTLNSENEIQ